MTFDEILDFNKQYSYVQYCLYLEKNPEDNFITIKEIYSIDLVCGFGDTEPFKDVILNEDLIKLFDEWKGNGHYSLEFIYKNTIDYDEFRSWIIYDIEDFKYYKYEDDELNFSNNIPFDWSGLV